MDRKTTTDLLTLAALVWLQHREGAMFTEVPITDRYNSAGRLDVLHVGKAERELTAVEIKADKSDIDTYQLERYYECTKYLWLATVPGVIDNFSTRRKIPHEVGILELNLTWPLVGVGMFQRAVENREQWDDVFTIIRKPQANKVKPATAMQIMHTLAISPRRVDRNWGMNTARCKALEQQLAGERAIYHNVTGQA